MIDYRVNPGGLPDCPFCGLPVYLEDVVEHPCCSYARARGDLVCVGCESFRNDKPTSERNARWQPGKFDAL